MWRSYIICFILGPVSTVANTYSVWAAFPFKRCLKYCYFSVSDFKENCTIIFKNTVLVLSWRIRPNKKSSEWSGLRSAVWSAMWSVEWSGKWSAVRPSMKLSVWPGTWSAVKPSKKSSVWSGIWSAVCPGVQYAKWSDMWSTVRSCVRPAVWSCKDI
jgi:hypothetical protein